MFCGHSLQEYVYLQIRMASQTVLMLVVVLFHSVVRYVFLADMAQEVLLVLDEANW